MHWHQGLSVTGRTDIWQNTDKSSEPPTSSKSSCCPFVMTKKILIRSLLIFFSTLVLTATVVTPSPYTSVYLFYSFSKCLKYICRIQPIEWHSWAILYWTKQTGWGIKLKKHTVCWVETPCRLIDVCLYLQLWTCRQYVVTKSVRAVVPDVAPASSDRCQYFQSHRNLWRSSEAAKRAETCSVLHKAT